MYVHVARDDELHTYMFLCGQCVLNLMNSEIMLKGLFTYDIGLLFD